MTHCRLSAVLVIAVAVGCDPANDEGTSDHASDGGSTDGAPTGTADGSGNSQTSGASGEMTAGGTDGGPSGDAGTGGGDAPADDGEDQGGDSGGNDDDDDDGGDEAGSTGIPEVEECEALAEMVEFESSPPPGETKVEGLGDCVTVLDGEVLWNYHCQWCHSTLDDNDIQERTLDKVWWAVDLSEDLANWPVGGLSDYPDAVESIYEALLASPEATVPAHPHPLPEYE